MCPPPPRAGSSTEPSIRNRTDPSGHGAGGAPGTPVSPRVCVGGEILSNALLAAELNSVQIRLYEGSLPRGHEMRPAQGLARSASPGSFPKASIYGEAQWVRLPFCPTEWPSKPHPPDTHPLDGGEDGPTGMLDRGR
jgi:hypothetical protein